MHRSHLSRLAAGSQAHAVITDNKNGLEDSLVKKLKSSTSANGDLNQSSDDDSLTKHTNTRNKNVALLFSNLSCSPGESVFSIDHILESIFAELDRETLLNCRLVSRRSLHFSSERLRKIVTITFRKYVRYCNNYQKESGVFCLDPWRMDRTTKSLMTSMNSSINFPCSSFSFTYSMDGNQRFFSAQGRFITKLQLHGDLLLSDLKRFFLIQAPNLEELKLHNVAYRFTDADYRLKKLETEEARQRRRESSFDSTTIREKPVFKSFKKYITLYTPGVPHDFLQQLMECSPNIVEVNIPFNRLPLLVQPVNRIHLVKKLELYIHNGNMKSLIALANNNPNNWAVQKIILYSLNVVRDEAIALQAAEALSKILKRCSKTCQKLRWCEGFSNFQISLMHGLKHVHFRGTNTLPVYIFPRGVGLGDLFPDLRSNKISFLSVFRKNYLSIKQMFGNDDPVPVPLLYVRNVFLNFIPAQQLLENIQEKFLNAVIKSTEAAGFQRRDEEDGVETETEVESDDEEV